MPEVWYASVGPTERLTQGDIIIDCPLIGWKGEIGGIEGAEETEVLKQALDAFVADTVVMTQACDLEHDKVANVVLCPHYPLAGYRADWESAMKSRNQNPTDKSWRRHCEEISEGLVWNLAILNLLTDGPLTTEHRIVDFHEVFTVPRAFLETLIIGRNRYRLRLLPPYREHLSQAFARFFMRVGLPVPVTTGW
jgi:hypothetical protein